MAVDSDLLRAARYLIDQYGGNAAGIAERRAAALPQRDEGSSAPTWRRIARTVRKLQLAEAARAGF